MKELLLNIIDFIRYQIENDKCTLDELQSLTKTLTESLQVDATIEDIAKFYDQPRSNVSNLISRKLPSKYAPKRRVYYNFTKIAEIVPKNWVK